MKNARQCEITEVYNGQSLEQLANKYNITVSDLIENNPELDFNQLKPGQVICIPSVNSTCPIGSIPYKVKSGDTLSSIATEYLTTDEMLLSINATVDPNNLVVGQVICVIEDRPKVPSCPSLNIYVINKGDTVYGIASKFGITVEALLNVNPNLDPFNLIIDEVICLPFTPTPYIMVIDVKSKTLSLYYLGKFIKSFSIAVGKVETPTPIGNFYIYNKQVNPGGPFGSRWMGLSIPSYGIHGTNRPDLIGKAVSNGCIRMHNQDVEELFSIISVNTPVIIY